MTEFKVGDRVKVTRTTEFEGYVGFVDGRTGDFDVYEGPDKGGNFLGHARSEGARVTVERVEPPVEVFKPGDVVRSRGTGSVYALTDRGFVRLHGWGNMPYANGVEVPFDNEGEFTSNSYEKVNIG